MSNASHTHLDPEPSDRRALYSAIGWIGVLLLFTLIVVVAYIPNRAVDAGTVRAEERLQIRDQTIARQKRVAQSYEWVDQSNGVVRIPIERAMKLTVEDLRQQP